MKYEICDVEIVSFRLGGDLLDILSPKRNPLTAIIEQVASEYEVEPDDLGGPSKLGLFVRPRHEVMRRARESGFSLSEIGRALNRDHTTVMHGIKRAKKRAGVL